MITFNQIIGHERQLSLLRLLLREGTVGGTYLFCGPEHVGKETTAMALAMALLCEQPDGFGCGECKACNEVQNGAHPDLTVLSPLGVSQSIKLEQIETLRHRFQLSSFHGGWKIGIVREAHTLHHQSAPALLKILEEPPLRSVFLLISHREDQVIPTLRSRAKIVPFFPLPNALVEKAIAQTFPMDTGTRESLLKLAGGRLGMARRIAGGDFLSRRDKILSHVENLSFPRFGSILEALDGLVNLGKVQDASASSSGDGERREDQRRLERELLFILQTLVRDAWMLRNGRDAFVLNSDRADRLKKISARWQNVRLEEMLEFLERAGKDLESNVSLRLILERILTTA